MSSACLRLDVGWADMGCTQGSHGRVHLSVLAQGPASLPLCLMRPHSMSCLLAHGHSRPHSALGSLLSTWLSHYRRVQCLFLGRQRQQPNRNTFHTYPKNLGHHLRSFSNSGHVTQDAGSCRASAPEPATPRHLPCTEKAGK